jgi:O-antigen/teichoic acid export membrane protein
MNKSGRNKLYTDLLWYTAGNIIPILIALIKSPIFTRYFTPAEYGYYSITTITFALLSIVLFTSISSCIWRFYNKYKRSNNLTGFYSLLSIFYTISIVILLTISIVWVALNNNAIITRLVKLCFWQFTTAELIVIFLVILKLEEKAALYNIINSLKTLISFILLYILTFMLRYRVEALILSNAAINSVILLILILANTRHFRFSFKSVSKNEIKEFLNFGGVSVFAKAGLLILMFSDRYVIKIFDDFSNVGIYNQVYNLGQISLVTLATVFFSTISPRLNRELESNVSRTSKLIRKYIKIYIFYMLPLTVYLSLFAWQVAFILLGKEFRSGYTIIPYIMFSSFIYGITMFHDIHLKFSNQLRTVLLGVIIAVLINVTLNFILIPLFGYKWAAITTLLSYLVLFLYYNKHIDFSYLKYKTNLDHLKLITLVLISQVAIDLVIRKVLKIDINILFTILEGFIFLIAFFIITNKFIRDKILNFFVHKKS